MGLIRKEDHKFFTIGIIAGLITIPLGCFVAGLIAGFQIPMLLSNLVPIVLISIILSIALLRFPSKTMLGFAYFARAIVALATLSTAAIVIETLTGLIIIPGMTPISEAIQTI